PSRAPGGGRRGPPRAVGGAPPPRSPWARVSFGVKLHSEQRLCRRIGRLDQQARIDEEQEIEQAGHRKHGLELVWHRLEWLCRLLQIHNLYHFQIIRSADGAGG